MPGSPSLLRLGPLAALGLILGAPGAAPAQTGPVPSWQTCAAQTGSDADRLRCYDQWARQQQAEAAAINAQAAASEPGAGITTNRPASTGDTATTAVASGPAAPLAAPEAPVVPRCHDTRFSVLSRIWELESGTDCGVFSLRGYHPVTLSMAQSSNVNRTPGTPNPDNQSTDVDGYRRSEARIQLSVRTKIAQGLLTPREGGAVDSLWLGYSQQSFWQVFTPQLSRPFRATDHEPELIYVYPSTLDLGSWRVRYSGLGLVHQSNGQSLPLSRSWNRVYLMGGMESKDGRFRLTGRVWKRIHESADSDDNPDIVEHIGRAELTGSWTLSNRDNLLLTLRHPLINANGKGSARLEWMHALGPQGEGGWLRSGLRLHTQLFHGYGDSLIDYNVRKTVFMLGLSLMDF
ncbi:phospholipase A [Pseudorhodoferax sp.]|uniref:phospholipase A n=1 Tax=Pseudorhodoferax sp. TaxID=1993553 RepID=UPI0039E44D56